MKTKILLIAILMCSAQLTWSANRGIIFQKQAISGYVPDERVFKLDCTIFADRAVISYEKRDIKAHIEKKIKHLKEVNELIDEAKNGEIVTHPAPTDIGIKIYKAFKNLGNDQIIEIDLGSIIEGAKITQNRSPAAPVLKEYIDSICHLNIE